MFTNMKPTAAMLAITVLLAAPYPATAKLQPHSVLLLKETAAVPLKTCHDAFNRNRSKIEALYRRSDSPAIAALMHESGCEQMAAVSAGTDNPTPVEWWIVCRYGFRYLCIFGTGEPPKEYFN